MPKDELTTYEAMLDQNENIAKIITPQMANVVWACGDFTVNSLSELWHKNLKENIPHYKEHGSLTDHFLGFGKNKAVIGVGGGPSLNKNKNVLHELYALNSQLHLSEQPFIIISSNKSYKTLLDMGIFPHFVILVDAGDVLYSQLCEKIPVWAKGSILICPLHVSPKIIKKWHKMGNQVCFFLTGDEKEREVFEKETGESSEKLHIQQGGNVMNTIWVLCHRILGCGVYMMVGSDLAYKFTSPEKRQSEFYADGNYTLNILNRRDEAKTKLDWMGFELEQSALVPDTTIMNFNIMSTSRQMWVYKSWLEVQSMLWSDQISFQIYNCSESGILGVLARSLERDDLYQRDNWYLMDELLPSKWHTRTLYFAAKEFLEVLKRCQDQAGILTGAKCTVH